MKTVTDTIWTNGIHFLACGFGSGASRWAPGTMGTLMAIPFYLLFAHVSLLSYLLLTISAALIGIKLCTVTARDFGEHDHSSIVWDEIVGYFITMIAIPPSIYSILLGFVLFRWFDIWKPWPISWVDRNIHGGLGIMLDDIIAGLLALVLMQMIFFWIR